MKWGYESDAFDEAEVEKARQERNRNENDTSPSGGKGMICGHCGRRQNCTAIAGSCCYFCHNTLRR
jgi:hypothetical protein